ncbi:WD repeat-containing protein 18 isoform X2 [Ischnura elegans]|uniref:WD repeat-containing protein 18 isoform X2 n=1 Tax=Ischnura elegans TaxID=197161 RepID=UPI001ED890DC|nr:WD repeat-containing protein 18 isoform X2 [Ischnura elegans]
MHGSSVSVFVSVPQFLAFIYWESKLFLNDCHVILPNYIMSDLREVAVTSDSSGQLWNTCIWDPHVGTTLMTYKGGVSHSHGLSFVGRDYLMSADLAKPILHVWALNRQEQLQIRMVMPAKVSALAVSPNGTYCVCGIGEKLHVWHVSSGRLMAVLSKNFQRINCVRFTDDSSHFITAAEDGLVMVWPLGRVVALTQDLFRGVSDLAEPRYSYDDHTLSVTDIYVGKGGMRTRLLTASLDGRTNIYDLASGKMLLSLVFDDPLTSVTMCNAETQAFVGTVNGKIYQYSLHSPPRNLVHHITDVEKENVFLGHSNVIISLSVSLDGIFLLSGSLDELVIIWDVSSMQCLRKLQHKGPVTNAFFSLVPSNIFSNDLKPSLVLSSFKKETSVDAEEKFSVHLLNGENVLQSHKSVKTSFNNLNPISNLREKEEIQRLKKINNQLYGFIVKKLIGKEEDENHSLSTTEENERTESLKRKKIKTTHTHGFIVTEMS